MSNPDFENGGLSRSAYRGARYRGATAVDQIAAEMLGALRESRLVYGYHPDLDKRGHESGVDAGGAGSVRRFRPQRRRAWPVI